MFKSCGLLHEAGFVPKLNHKAMLFGWSMVVLHLAVVVFHPAVVVLHLAVCSYIAKQGYSRMEESFVPATIKIGGAL